MFFARTGGQASIVFLSYALLVLSAREAHAIEAKTVVSAQASGENIPPLRLVEKAKTNPVAELAPAAIEAPSELINLALWNEAGHEPPRNGFARGLPSPIHVTLASDFKGIEASYQGGVATRLPSGDLIWGTSFHVANSYQISLHLAEVNLPSGSTLWVYGDDPVDSVSFGLEILYGHEVYTPPVDGPTLRLEIQLPASELVTGARFSFTIDSITELFKLDDRGRPDLQHSIPAKDSCSVDAACIHPGVEDGLPTHQWVEEHKKATARLQITSGNNTAPCTGVLIATNPPSNIPYLLTAAHCVHNQALASRLVAWFDYLPSTCNGTAPSLGSRPKSVGAQFLAESDNDLALLRLNTLPEGRSLLGWSSSEFFFPDLILTTFSHPNGNPMEFMETDGTPSLDCFGESRPNYIISRRASKNTNFYTGRIALGSSGAGVMGGSTLDGALRGYCSIPGLSCDNEFEKRTIIVHGALAHFVGSICRYLCPEFVPAAPTNLKVTKTTNGFTFAWEDNSNNESYFRVELMRLPNGIFQSVGTTQVPRFEIGYPLRGTYLARVVAFGAGDSFPSNSVRFTVRR